MMFFIYNRQAFNLVLKTNSECANAISCLTSATRCFNDNGLVVSLRILDITKAFDKTNHYDLYIGLTKREVQLPSSLGLVHTGETALKHW